MKNKKGFTLIELLAVIVILAIIALIATPIILNIINDARKSAAVDSAYGYIEAIDYNNAMSQLNGKYKKIESGEVTSFNNKVNVKGTKPTSGTIEVDASGRVIKATLVINGYEVKYEDGEATVEGKVTDNENKEEKEEQPEDEQPEEEVEEETVLNNVQVYDYQTTKNEKIKYVNGMYVIKVDGTDVYPEFSFLTKLDDDAEISSVKMFYDLDYINNQSNSYSNDEFHRMIVQWSSSDVTKGTIKNVFRYDSTFNLLLDDDGKQIPEIYENEGTSYTKAATVLKLQPLYFEPYNGQYTNIVIQVTDTNGNVYYSRIKVQI